MAATRLTIVAALIAAAHWGRLAGCSHLAHAGGSHLAHAGGEEYGPEVHVSSSVLQLGGVSHTAPLEAIGWHEPQLPADWEQPEQAVGHIGGAVEWAPEEASHLGGSVFSSNQEPSLKLGGGLLHGPLRGVDLPEIKDNVDDWKEPQHYKTSYGK